MIDAQEAFRIGLVNRVVAPEALMPSALALVARMIANGPLAIALAIEAVDHGFHSTTEDALRLESNLFGLLASTKDMQEGMAAFLEKRKAAFKGE
jgi:enoyl-CoA hydratase